MLPFFVPVFFTFYIQDVLKFKRKFQLPRVNIAEYLNANYKEDQFVKLVNHESTQPIMNSIIKPAAKITEELNQLSGKSDAKQDEIQHMKERLGEVLKKKMGKQSNAWAVRKEYG
jgi:hypothetical protein